MSTANAIFTVERYEFPYLYKFPGQSSDERILFITRESDIILIFRQVMVALAAGTIFLAGVAVAQILRNLVGESVGGMVEVLSAVAALAFGAAGFWWVTTLWKKSIALITNKRLSKFIYTTPWNRHNLSLPLDMIVDTGAYSKGFLQAAFKLGTFTARSSAASSGTATDDPGRVNKKYFYIENVTNAEDIHHYLHKVLFVFRQDWQKLDDFRPFLPHLKGEARKEFMKKYPEYWS
ncbi:hypothetical protein H3C66_00020 [Patescibacteria group bacterium]|nr:hypothetical protein [Patescibacteria group bacterium]